jgi:hypothetical protein
MARKPKIKGLSGGSKGGFIKGPATSLLKGGKKGMSKGK